MRSPIRTILQAPLLLLLFWMPGINAQEPREIRVGSKVFTESVILGELLAEVARRTGCRATHDREYGGTQILWKALQSGAIDAYVEYTGTLREEILANENLKTNQEVKDRLSEHHVVLCDPLGFNNTYALGMRLDTAESLGVERISQLSLHPDLRFGFSGEFFDRDDCWPGLQRTYGLPHTSIRSLEHTLAYRGIASDSLDVIDLYSTDAEIAAYDLLVLDDDLNFFPDYEAVILYRADLEKTHPDVVEQFNLLRGSISDAAMISMNKRVRIDREPESGVATDFVNRLSDPNAEATKVNSRQLQIQRFIANTGDHIVLVGVSLTLAIICAIPLGVIAYRIPRWGEWILGTVGVLQTLPSLALFSALIPLLGLGAKPAIFALFLYSLLPIVRGTHTGLVTIAPSIRESAMALGLPSLARLRLVELPMAAQSILSGIKTSAVINVGTATIGALIGAGGYGEPIVSGLRLDDQWLVLQGAIPAAILALAVQAFFGQLERVLIPRGIRT